MWQKALDLLHISLQSWQLQPTVPQKQLNKGLRAVQSTDSDFSQRGTLVSQFFFTDAKVVSYSSTISACGKSIQWQFAVQLLSTLTSRLSILRDSDLAECDAAFASTLTACQALSRNVQSKCPCCAEELLRPNHG